MTKKTSFFATLLNTLIYRLDQQFFGRKRLHFTTWWLSKFGIGIGVNLESLLNSG